MTTVQGRAESRAGDPAGDRTPMIALSMARSIVALVFCGFAGVALLWVLDMGTAPGEFALAVGCLSGLLGLQYFYFCRPSTDLHSRPAYLMLAAQAGLAYLPLLVFEDAWLSQASFLAGSVLLVLPVAAAWPAYAAVVASTGLTTQLISGTPKDVAYILVNTATTGLFVYGLTRLARLVAALHEARDELAKATVAHERLRFARDLQDVLGLSLSAIAPKGELTLRLVGRDPDRARQELSGILRLARRAVADARAIAHLYWQDSAHEEPTTLVSTLAASHVELRVDLDLRELPPHSRTALSGVLREGVASVLRRGDLERCEIVVRQQGDSVSVDIIHDVTGVRARNRRRAASTTCRRWCPGRRAR